MPFPDTGKAISSWAFRKPAIGTLVERTTRFTILLYLPPMTDKGPESEERASRGGPRRGGGS